MKIANITRKDDVVTIFLKKEMKLGKDLSVEIYRDMVKCVVDFENGILDEVRNNIYTFEFHEKEDGTFKITKDVIELNK